MMTVPDSRAQGPGDGVKWWPLAIADVLSFVVSESNDSRGYFLETYSQDILERAGVSHTFVQDNESYSRQAGTVRGLHFQLPPVAQTKLVRVVAGAIFDVAVDLRRQSPTYGAWCGAVLSAENRRQLLIPAGFAHGFCTTEDDTIVAYKVSARYSPQHERGLRWNDPDLAIDWPSEARHAIVSVRDAQLPFLRDLALSSARVG